MEWLLASMVALIDETRAKPLGAFRGFLDERALGLANMLAESRRDAAKAADGAATQLGRDAEMIDALVAEIDALNREVVEVTARNVVLREEQARLEARHNADRAHIRDLIAELVRRDFR